MKNLLQGFLVGVAAIAFLTASGCVASRPESAAYCPKCETVWVRMKEGEKLYRLCTAFRTTEHCADCDAAIEEGLRSGVFPDRCGTCGAEIKRMGVPVQPWNRPVPFH